MNILFVCTGNTCRSPMAEKILTKYAEEMNTPLEIRSAGIAAIDGQEASKHAQKVIEEYGANVEHITQKVSEELIEWSDLVLTMTGLHKQILLEMYPQYAKKITTLSTIDIADPFGGSLDDYRRTAKEIEDSLKNLPIYK